MKITKTQLKQIIKEELEVTKQSNKPVKIDQSKNGVRVIVTRYPGKGSTVEADCECFGIVGRVHSNSFCPLLKKLLNKNGETFRN